MAEYCLDCWNRINHVKDTEEDWILSEEPDLCEGCGRWKRVVVREREHRLLYRLRRKLNM